MTPTPLINRTEVRALAVAVLFAARLDLFKKFASEDGTIRIADEFFCAIEAATRAAIVRAVATAPTIGRTLKTP